MIYKFSVGKATLTSLQTGYVKVVDVATSIEFNYDMTTIKEVGPDGIPTDEIKDEEKITLSFEFTDDVDTALIAGQTYDIVLTPGVEGGGISLSLENCRLTNYNVRTSQNNFVAIRVSFSKVGPIDSGTATKQQIAFGGVALGDSAYLVPSYQGNVINRIIPTALGTIFQTTGQTGGGLTTIKVKARVKKSTRLELEQYVTNLFSILSTSKASLVVSQGVTSYTLTNCIYVNGSMHDIYKNYVEMEFEFQRSSY